MPTSAYHRHRPRPERQAAHHTPRASVWLALLCSVSLDCLLPPLAAAQEKSGPSESGLSPTYLWLSASGALLAASLGGVYAFRVGAIYDQARALPPVSPMLQSLHRDAEHAELTADSLFAGALVLGVTSVLLAFVTQWRRDPPPTSIEWSSRGQTPFQLLPAASRDGAGLVVRGALP